MAFAPFDSLPAVKSSLRSTHLGGLHALTIHTPCGRVLVSVFLFTHLCSQVVMNPHPYPTQTPLSKVVINALPLWIVSRQHSPLNPSFRHIKDGVQNLPHTKFASSSTRFGTWYQLFDKIPLLIGEVAWIQFFVHVPILSDRRGLFRQALRSK